MTRRLKKMNRLGKDARIAAVDMSKTEALQVLQAYINLQRPQQRTKAYVRNLEKTGASNTAMKFIANNITYIRKYQFTEILDIWSDQFPEAKWAKSIRGVGPIIASGLVLCIDMNKAKSPSSLWYWAGQEPNSRRMTAKAADRLCMEAAENFGDELTEKHIRWVCKITGRDFERFHKFCRKAGKPYSWDKLFIALRWPRYNPTLKNICNMLGNDFIKHKSLYQDLYKYRLEWEERQNEAGGFKKLARKYLSSFDFKPWKDAYKTYSTGRLPRSHLIARAKRFAVKIFLAHYYSVSYYIREGTVPYNAYALDILKGYRRILVPNTEVLDG